MSQGVSRRSALRGGMIVVLGGAAGYSLARNSSAAKEERGMTAANAYGPASSTGGAALASVASIPLGGGRILGQPPIVLVRPPGGTVRAFSAICTHQGCTVSTVTDGTINCPCHGSQFAIADGSVVNGPAQKPLPAKKITVAGGTITAA